MKKILLLCSGLLLVAGLFLIAKGILFYNRIYTPKKILFKKFGPIKPKTDYNILLLGYGGEGHEGAYLTDTMMVVHFDTKTKKTTLVSVPRDIWVGLPTKSGEDFHGKINTVYQTELFPETFPDIKTDDELTKKTIEKITGLTMDNYIAIDFTAFKKALDILGGTDINVERTFTDNKYPIAGKEDELCGKKEEELPELEKIATESPELAFPCRYETIGFDAGFQHMDGERALKYVRSRNAREDGGDFGRATRQQRFLEAIKKKVLNIGFIPKIPSLLDEFGNHMKTDIAPSELGKYMKEAQKADEYKTENIVLSDNDYLDFGRSSNGQSILVPKAGKDNWREVRTWIADAIKGIAKNITPTP